MEKISRIRQNKNRFFTVTFESGERITVSEDVLVRNRLLKDMTLSEEQIARVKQESDVDRGFQAALNYLSYQLRSEKELKSYLRQKEIPEEQFGTIFTRLKELKLVDDRQYSQSYIRTMKRTSDKGPYILRQQLLKRGIRQGDIDDALLEFPEAEQLELAKKVVLKGAKKYARKPYKEQIRKIVELLHVKGFERDLIQQAVSEVALEKDESQEEAILKEQGEKLWERNRRFDPGKRRQKVIQALMQRGFSYEKAKEFMRTKEEFDEE